MTEPKDFKWALQVTGLSLDMEDAVALCANADPMMHIVRGSDGKPFAILTSLQLDALGTAREVDEVAQRLLALINGALFVIDPARTPLAAAGTIERCANGKWKHHLMAADLVTRSPRVGTIGIAIAGQEPSRPTRSPTSSLAMVGGGSAGSSCSRCTKVS